MGRNAEPIGAEELKGDRRRWEAWVRRRRGPLIPVLGAELAVLLAIFAIAAFEAYFSARIYPGVSIVGIPVGGLPIDDARSAVEHELTSYALQSIQLTYGDRTWSLLLRDLGYAVDGSAAVAKAYAVGRAADEGAAAGRQPPLTGAWRTFWSDLVSQWSALRSGVTISPPIQLDDGRLTYQLMRVAREVDQAPQEGHLQGRSGRYVAIAGRPGRRVNVEKTRLALKQALLVGNQPSVPLVVEDLPPALASVDGAAIQATLLLSQPFTLTASFRDGPRRVAIDQTTIVAWLDLTPRLLGSGQTELRVRLKREPTGAYLRRWASEINRPAEDARLDFDPAGRQVTVLKPGQAGEALDLDGGLAAIEAALQRGDHEVAFPVHSVPPRIDAERLPAIDRLELIAEGTTRFAGSSPERVQNIVAAAGRLRGVVVPPGEEFSFNGYVGEINAENGFTEGLIIWGDRTAVGIGGGVCQVSTTLFRAAFFAGFPITQRTAHGYVVSWYGEPGLDATIYTPDVDFRFRNDSSGLLFIRPNINTETGSVTFSLYGVRQPRTVEMIGPQISNVRPPPRPLYQEDKSLAQGVIKQVDWAQDGRDVVVIRRIRQADGTVRDEKFASQYQPWRAVFHYGPGTKLPAGANAGDAD